MKIANLLIAQRSTKPHENTVYLTSIRQQAFPRVASEILLKELFEPQAGELTCNLTSLVGSQSIMQRATAGYADNPD